VGRLEDQLEPRQRGQGGVLGAHPLAQRRPGEARQRVDLDQVLLEEQVEAGQGGLPLGRRQRAGALDLGQDRLGAPRRRDAAGQEVEERVGRGGRADRPERAAPPPGQPAEPIRDRGNRAQLDRLTRYML
jgi:hypothetical protein